MIGSADSTDREIGSNPMETCVYMFCCIVYPVVKLTLITGGNDRVSGLSIPVHDISSKMAVSQKD